MMALLFGRHLILRVLVAGGNLDMLIKWMTTFQPELSVFTWEFRNYEFSESLDFLS